MTQELNRAARRSEARKSSNRKSGMAALSIVATSSLISSYLSLLRTDLSFAVAGTSGCASQPVQLTLDVSGTASLDVTRIQQLQSELTDELSGDTDRCVTVTFSSGQSDSVLNFAYWDTANQIETVADLNIVSGAVGSKVFFVGNSVTFDFSLDSGSLPWPTSPIETVIALEIHDITFEKAKVNTGYGAVIRAESNLSIFDSTFDDNEIMGTGEGGAVSAGTNAVIRNTTFTNNRAGDKGGALRLGASSSISGSTFLSNTASDIGGAIFASGADTNITESTFSSNTAANGGAIFASGEGTGITGSTFLSNTVSNDGGAIRATGSGATVTGSTFSSNTANRFGGAISNSAAGATITGSTFSTNGAVDGGALHLREADATISLSTFASNTASRNAGAAYVYSSNATITGSTFTANIATYDGGAIYVDDPDASITTSTFSSNTADRRGGAIYIDATNATITASTFSSNTADTKGGAIYIDQSDASITGSTFAFNTSENQGGAIFVDGEEATIAGSTFTENNSIRSHGGAIEISANFVTVSGSTFSSNEVNANNGFGGAINIVSRDATVSGSTFSSNTARRGGAIAIYEDDATITGSTFSLNTAISHGGAIYIYDDPGYADAATIRSSTFTSNSSGNSGGAIFAGGALGTFSNSTFVGNSAYVGGAIHADSGNSIFFSTFLNNSSTTGGQALWIEDGQIAGNIFAGSGSRQIEFNNADPSIRPIELIYNLSTGDDFDEDSPSETTNRGSVPIGDLHLDSQLRANENPNGPQTIAITNALSTAFQFVPLAVAEDRLTALVDQRGVSRTAARVTAGAFEGSITPTIFTGGGVAAAPPAFFVFDVKPRNKKAKPIINVSGSLLLGVSEVFVDGTKVRILRQSSSGLSFRLPVKARGPIEIRITGKGLEHKHILNLDGSIRNETVVPGFASNSTKLTRGMKREIKAFVESNASLTSVTCKGFTSAPATMQDLRLARDRGQATCDYIKKLNPELEVQVLPGSHTNTPGQKIRRVRIEMQ